MIDLVDQVFDRRERAAANGLVGDEREESFDLVEPRAVGRDEVHVPPRSAGQPRTHLRMRVRGVVVDDAVNVQFRRHRLIDPAQEQQELLMAMARFALGQHSTVEHVECRKQRRRAVANVVVRHAFDVAQSQGGPESP